MASAKRWKWITDDPMGEAEPPGPAATDPEATHGPPGRLDHQ
ncbi:MAG TPA: hypothetical protein VGX25_27975 [Actinophytocola sp.]|nr:hypothetical protein [Actinophytocola sp.]HEV2783240.1 hypothetical protein [Actinophytocola sp.]